MGFVPAAWPEFYACMLSPDTRIDASPLATDLLLTIGETVQEEKTRLMPKALGTWGTDIIVYLRYDRCLR